ncbi:ribosomal protein S18-alanine N-acetyltransferase [Hathewaya limosa]|uniref:[Ribosomal protein bS18]-alanine N-acetyltransferase n=1 Tax=Hathewaya limosa TaxID=1536 RepID=A0ABU0JQ91_HATLI|nr:ribosomal protein S18-alanine N-acetyltransferase [Hathewaya limosa]AWZ49288.1 ribosomal-protein-alanine N-acetyltransferase [Clostridiaceae bacterium 14S0207]MDQ0478421.1 ribosomal-protein-alanine N-acetyltransferase [Hathewaya limosa]
MSSNTFTYTTMTHEDLNQVYEINKLSLKTPWSINSLEDEFSNNFSHYITCKDSTGKILGFGGIWIIHGEGQITNIAVHPNFRRNGIASRILEELKTLCQKENCNAITLEVRSSNIPAQTLYIKEGFKNEGIRKNFYSNPKEDALIMWCYDL